MLTQHNTRYTMFQVRVSNQSVTATDTSDTTKLPFMQLKPQLELKEHIRRGCVVNPPLCAGEGVEKMARKVSHAYVQGLTWVLTYYIHGNTPVPITNAHKDARTEAQERLQGKGNSASDSSEGLGAAWDWSVTDISNIAIKTAAYPLVKHNFLLALSRLPLLTQHVSVAVFVFRSTAAATSG